MTAMSEAHDGSARRASARRAWPVRKYRLGEEPSDDLGDVTSAEERLEMMGQLTLEAWTLAGKPLPDYDRSEAPVRKFMRKVS